MQAQSGWDIIGDDDDDDLEHGAYMEALKDVILVAIDCSPSMLASQDVSDSERGSRLSTASTSANAVYSHLFATLRSVVDLLKRKAMFYPNDMVGILLFNTMESQQLDEKRTAMKPHIIVFQDISEVNADLIQTIMSILHGVESQGISLEDNFRPWSRRVPLGDVFSACNWLLRDQAPKAATKRIFLVTDEDNPHEGNAQLDRITKQNYADLCALGVQVVPFFISTPSKPFVVTKRFSEILTQTLDEDEEGLQTIPTVIEGFEKFLNAMRIREAPKRSQFSINMTLGNGLVIGVKGYGMVLEQKKATPKSFKDVDGELKELTNKTVYFAEGSLDDSIKGQVVYGMSLKTDEDAEDTGGGEASRDLTERDGANAVVQPSQVYYTADDVKSFRTLGMDPGIRILGFKDADTLAFEDNIKHSFFIYPNEAVYKGSTRAFNALLKTLVEKDKIGLAIGLFRRNSSPYFYAMLPQEEVLDESGDQKTPPGFNLVPLPYADDIRTAPVEESYKASDDAVTAASAWMKKLKIAKGYEPDSFRNPSLNLFYSQLEAMALREEFNSAEFNDMTAPKSELIVQRAGALIKSWKDVLAEDPSTRIELAPKPGTKRKAEVEVDELDVRDRYEKGQLNKLTAATLKEFLKSKSQPTNGLKADLVERAAAWLAQH